MRAKLTSTWNELPARNGRWLSSGSTQVGPEGQRGRDTQGAQSWMEHLATPVCKENGEAHDWPSSGLCLEGCQKPARGKPGPSVLSESGEEADGRAAGGRALFLR